MTNKQICDVLQQIGELLELQGENPFKYRTYFKAVETITALDASVQELMEQGTLGNLPGFGKALTTKVSELIETGKLEYYERLKQAVPAELYAIAELPGMDRRKTGLLYLKLGISTLDELTQACRAGRMAGVRGFHKDDEQRLLKVIGERLSS
jgi:DNA polymerase (family 10)